MPNSILLLGVDADVTALLQRHVHGQHRVEDEIDSSAVVERIRRAPFRYDAIVIGDGIPEPVRLLQDVAAIRKDLPSIVLCKPGRVEALQRSMQFTPFLPAALSLQLARPAESAADAIHEAAQQVRRRRRYTSIVESSSAAHALPLSDDGPARAYLASLMDVLSGTVVLFDDDLRAEQWNEAAENFFTPGTLRHHRRLNDLVGRSAADKLRHFETSSEGLQITLEGRDSFEAVRARLVPVQPRSETIGYVLTIDRLPQTEVASVADHDESLRERADELRRMNEALRRSNRELEDFAYTASHDLQEPLRKINSFSDLLRADFADVLNGDGALYLDRLQDASNRMIDLIRGLLAYSRVATADVAFRTIELEHVARQVVSDLEVAIKESGAEVTVARLARVEADPIQMRQLFQNLIGNGIKFRRDDEAPRITIELLPSEDPATVRIAVSDNGIGIETRFIEKIFAPFQRLHGRNRFEGSGMGLAICRRIAQRHHGFITVTSEVDEGSTFVITLPIKQPDALG